MTKDEVLKAIQENNSYVIQRLDFLGFNSYEDIMLAVIDKDPSMLLTASPTLKKNKEFYLKVINKDVHSFRYIPGEYKGDEQIALLAIKLYPGSYTSLSDELNKNKKIILESVSKSGYLLDYVPEEFKNDYDVVLASVQQNCYSLEFASKDLQNNEIIYTTSISQDPRLINKFKKIPSNINDCVIIKYYELEFIDDFILIDSIDLFFNYIIYILKNIINEYQLSIGIRYLLNQYISDRLFYLFNHFKNYDNAVICFNEKKNKNNNFFLNLKSIYPNFKTYFIRNIQLDYSKSNGYLNVGVINLKGNNYFYKKLGSYGRTINIKTIIDFYNFIEKANKINIDNKQIVYPKNKCSKNK